MITPTTVTTTRIATMEASFPERSVSRDSTSLPALVRKGRLRRVHPDEEAFDLAGEPVKGCGLVVE
jgi:hypothetical protein